MKPKPALVAVTVVLATGVLAACTSGSVSPAQEVPTLAAATTSSVAATVEAPHVGDAITIAGNTAGSQVEVTLLQVVQTTSKDKIMKVGKKKQLIAVQFQIVNTGSVGYADAPGNGALVVDSQGGQTESTLLFTKIAAGALLPVAVKLPPGKKTVGYLAFEVPKGVTVKEVQFAMDSGFGGTGTWEVP